MQFLDDRGAREWCGQSRSGLPTEFGGARENLQIVNAKSAIHIESSLSISRRIVAWAANGFRCGLLIWVREHGIWQSSENMHLYYLWRRSHGDLTLLEDASAHLALAHEHEDATSLVYMGLLFGWGLTVVSEHRERSLNVDHDGNAWVLGGDASDAASIRSFLTK